jgi:anti-anti-sigma factor
MSMPEAIPVQEHDGTVVVCPVGELDLAVADELRSALARAVEFAHRGVRIDLGAVTFVDSTALAALVHAWRHAERRGIALCVVRPAPNVRRVLAITGLERLLCPD